MATNRGLVFVKGEIYHVFNRGVERRPVFTTRREYQRAIDAIWFYRFPQKLRLSFYYMLSKEEQEVFRRSMVTSDGDRLVTLLAYCFMPNHFHFLLRQEQENGTSTFVANVSNSYTRYFNTKHKRPGVLFQGPFKATHIETDEQLLHVSRYIHLNPVSSGIYRTEELETYEWSSLPEYLDTRHGGICNTSWLKEFFLTPEKYRQFIFDQADYAKKLESIKHLLLEEA